jgi:hypothetical protein
MSHLDVLMEAVGRPTRFTPGWCVKWDVSWCPPRNEMWDVPPGCSRGRIWDVPPGPLSWPKGLQESLVGRPVVFS